MKRDIHIYVNIYDFVWYSWNIWDSILNASIEDLFKDLLLFGDQVSAVGHAAILAVIQKYLPSLVIYILITNLYIILSWW